MPRPLTIQQSLPGLGRVLKRFWPHLRRERPMLAGSLLALFAEISLRALEPWPLKLVFDRISSSAISASAASAASARPPLGLPVLGALGALPTDALIVLAAAGVVAISGLRAAAEYANTIGFTLVGNRVLAQVRAELYYHVQGLSLSFHNRARAGDLLVRITGDVNMLRDVAVTALVPLAVNQLLLLSMVGVMFWMHWRLAAVVVVIFPLFWLVTSRLSRRIAEAARSQRRRQGAMAATAAESIGAIKNIQALALEGTFAAAFSSANKKSLGDEAKTARLEARLQRTVDTLVAVSTALVLWFGARLVTRSELTPGDLVVFLSYLKSAIKPARDLAKYAARLAKASAAGERVLELLDREPDVRDLPGAVPAENVRGALRFEDVAFKYEGADVDGDRDGDRDADGDARGAGGSAASPEQPATPVLEDVDLDVPPGMRVALVGHSGSGKSTLVSLLLRLYDPTRGRITLDGRDLRHYTIASLRSQISVVLQDSLLFAASVRDNIAYGVAGADAAAVTAAARLANAHDFIQALPQGYDTVLGERGVTLSNGQRQRLAIARAAVRRSPILILDEPTTGLDEENARAVIDALERLSRGRTTFIVTHDLHWASRADLILFLEGGRVREHGTHAALLAAGGRYATLFGLQAAARESHAVVRELDAVTA